MSGSGSLASAVSGVYALDLARYFVASVQQLINGDPSSLLDQHPFVLSLWMLAGVTLYTFVTPIFTKNYSSVDRLWSVLPFAYSTIWFAKAWPHSDARITAVTAITGVWGARLSYNFWRKGGYGAGHEDYRWEYLRRWIKYPYGVAGDVAWQVFNLLFIAGFQNVLLWSIVNPALLILWTAVGGKGGHGWTLMDTAVLVLAALCVLGETVADQQQWSYQTTKYRLLRHVQRRDEGSKKPAPVSSAPSRHAPASVAEQNELDRRQKQYLSMLPHPYNIGFLTSGLFRYSRHPNFFCEFSLWFVLYGFTVAAAPQSLVNWALAGPVVLCMLFQGSTWMTERVTQAKYPWYADYAGSTSRLVPMWSGRAIRAPAAGATKKQQ